MKRRIPELPAPPRRKRGLSEEERALWESVARQVKPLRKRHRPLKPEAVSPEAEIKLAPKPVARLSSLKEVCARTSLSRETIYALMTREEFPQNIIISDVGRSVRWLEAEVDAWI